MGKIVDDININIYNFFRILVTLYTAFFSVKIFNSHLEHYFIDTNQENILIKGYIRVTTEFGKNSTLRKIVS